VDANRCTASPAIIDQHDDVRSEVDELRQRQRVLEEVRDETTESE